MTTPRSSFDAHDVVQLAELAGLSLSGGDAQAVAVALAAHAEMVRPLFEAELDDTAVAPTYDPRWPDTDSSR